MHSVGILPAAGLGERWGRYPKFTLPCGDREWLLDRAMRSFPCDDVVIVYSCETFGPILNHLANTGFLNRVVLLKNERMDLDFYGSMLAAMQVEADYYYFAMPDTYYPPETFSRMADTGISLGVHRTETPERFGVLRNGIIVNKQLGKPGLAWGVLGWSREVRDLWLSAHVRSYTEAINLAMQETKATTVEMEYYYDMATWDDYAKFVEAVR